MLGEKKLPVMALTLGLLGLAGGAVHAATVDVSGGGSSQWNISDERITSNGLPSGGSCTGGAAGSGASIVDANIPAGSDAFDYAGMIWVNNTQVGGNLSAAGSRVTFSPVSISGLNAQIIYDVLGTSATLRVFLRLQNPTGSAIAVPVDYASNFGSDSSTQVRGSSSGDVSFTSADSWVVTSDFADSDPVNTTVIFGAGAASVTASSVSQTVFSCAGTEGVSSRYNVSVPAGETIALVFFQQLNDTTPNALAEALSFDSPDLDSDLLAGLSAGELALVQNFDFGASPAPPSTSEPIPTMSQYGLILTTLGLLLVAGRRLRASVGRS